MHSGFAFYVKPILIGVDKIRDWTIFVVQQIDIAYSHRGRLGTDAGNLVGFKQDVIAFASVIADGIVESTGRHCSRDIIERIVAFLRECIGRQ